jgi:hypothetical protein
LHKSPKATKIKAEVNYMGYAVIVEIPEELYQPFVKTAEQSGHTPEQLATNWLVANIRQAQQDPLEEFIGMFRSDITDWVDQHDRYLGQEQLEQMNKQPEVSRSDGGIVR